MLLEIVLEVNLKFQAEGRGVLKALGNEKIIS